MDKQLQRRIEVQLMTIDAANTCISDILSETIEDYHWMDFKCSNFWKCDDSPVGWCVWDMRETTNMRKVACRYCGNPTERK